MKGDNGDLPKKPRLILKSGKNGLAYSKDSTQLKKLVKNIPDSETKIEDTEVDPNDFPLVDTVLQYMYDNIEGLAPNENRELRRVLDPSDSVLSESRIGDNGVLQLQADYFEDAIEKTRERMVELNVKDNATVEENEEYIELQERLQGLEQARDRTIEQRGIEEVRKQQKEDVKRLPRLKEWMKKNALGLTSVTIIVAWIIMTITVSVRKALVAGAEVTSKFGKAVANLGKKLGSLLGPHLNVVAQVISLGAGSLGWLASNLWLLAIAFACFIYDLYKQNKR